MVKLNITQIKKLWLLALVVAKENSWGFNMFKEISSLSFKYMEVALTGSHFVTDVGVLTIETFQKEKLVF